MNVRFAPQLLFLALAVAFVLSGCATANQAGVTQTPEIEQVPNRPIPWEVTPPPGYREAVREGTRSSSGEPGPNYWIQEASYELNARLFPVSKRLEGDAVITYTNNSPDALEELHMEMAQNFHRGGVLRHEEAEITGGARVRQVTVRGDELTPAPLASENGPQFDIDGTALVLTPRAPVAPGETVAIEVEWSFDIPEEGVGARMGYDDDNLVHMAYWYPVMSVYDDVIGWHTEPFTGTAEFYNDFADYDVTVEVPEGWIVAASGELQNPEEVLAPHVLERMQEAYASDETVRVVGPEDFGEATAESEDGLLRWRFAAENVRDVAFSATNESIWDASRTAVGDRDGDGQLDFTNINTFYRESAPRWARVTEYQQHAITFFSQNLELPYPWPHMTAVEGGGIIGGGMEYPMMTLMGDYNAAGDSALYNVTAHELAHMWIPMIVNSNERAFSWIDEGFTTFNENEARMDFHPGEDHHLPDQRLYAAVAQQELEGEIMRPSAYHASALAFGIASYMKPASVFAALRGVLGDDTFYDAYRTFIDEWAYRHPYPWDIFNTFERVSGQDLDWFWRSWFYETWTLDQAIEEVNVDGNETTIVIRDEGLVPMPVLLGIEMESGEVVGRRLPVSTWLQGATTASFSITTDSPVVRVAIDPDNVFADVDLSDNDWYRDEETAGSE